MNLNIISEISTDELIGKTFGKLKVLPRTKNQNNGKRYLLCECRCGIRRRYKIEWLLSGLVKGCVFCREPYVNISNRRFGHLTALRPTDKRDKGDGSVMWECRCDCGEFAYRSYGKLKRSFENTSCGCMRPEINREKLKNRITFAEGTIIEKIKSQAIPDNNKSGVRGVCYNNDRQKWDAYINFKRRKYYLGRFEFLEDAANARAEAEKEIYLPFLEKYYAKINVKNNF